MLRKFTASWGLKTFAPLVIVLIPLLVACGEEAPEPAATVAPAPTAAPTATPEPTPPPEPTPTPQPTPTPNPTPTPEPTPTPKPTPTPAPTSTPAPPPTPTPPPTVDYDSDEDGLIEVSNLDQLNAIHWDLDGDGASDQPISEPDYNEAFPEAASTPGNMGCPESGCTGYELAQSLDFDDDASYAEFTGSINLSKRSWTTGEGWLPIGELDDPFLATFDGNGLVISNLYINRPRYVDLTSVESVGLLGFADADAEIRQVGLVGADVTGVAGVGALVGFAVEGTITDSYSTGSVAGAGNQVGGLVGTLDKGSTLTGSYSTATVSGGGNQVGGLVGALEKGATVKTSHSTGTVRGGQDVGGLVGINRGAITVSYTTGAVTGAARVGGLTGHAAGAMTVSYSTGVVTGDKSVGGLVGDMSGGTITASYNTGAVSASREVGGMVGNMVNGTITASYSLGLVTGTSVVGGLVGSIALGDITGTYWDTQTSGQSSSARGSGKTTTEFQSPTGYTGIYSGWNVDVDRSSGNDDPWDFGTGMEYPALKADFDGDGTATWQEFGNQRG